MSGRVMARDGEMVDQIAEAAYGRTAGATEAVLAANPHLSALPARLPVGTIIELPDMPVETTVATVRLWD